MVVKTKKATGRGRGRPPKATKDDEVNGEDKTIAKPTKTIEKESSGRKRGRPVGSGKKKGGFKKTKAAPKKKKASSDEESDHQDEPAMAEDDGEDKETEE